MLALALRMLGTVPGNWDYYQIGDEQTMIGAALRMGEERTLMARFDSLYYPPIMAYVFLPVIVVALGIHVLATGIDSQAALKAELIADPWVPLLAARLVAVAAGTVTVWVIMRVAGLLFGRMPGLCAGVLLATSLMHVQLSHFARMWVFTTLVAWLLVWVGVRLSRERRVPLLLLAGTLAGIGIGVHIVGVLALVVVPVSALIRSLRAASISPQPTNSRMQATFGALRQATSDALIALGPALVVTALAMFLAPQGFQMLLNEAPAAHQNRWTSERTPGVEKDFSERAVGYLGSYARFIVLFEPLLVVAAVCGAALLFRRRAWGFLLLIGSYPMVHVVFLLPFFVGDRYLLPILPALTVVAAPLIVPLAHLRGAWGWGLRTAALVGLVAQIGIVVQWDLLVGRPDTRTLAREWILTHVPNGARVLALGPDLHLPESRESAETARRLGLNATVAQQALMNDEFPEPIPSYVIVYYDSTESLPSGIDFDYLVLDALDPTEAPAEVLALAQGGELVAEILPGPVDRVDTDGVNTRMWFWNFRQLERAGPLIRIYKLRIPSTAG